MDPYLDISPITVAVLTTAWTVFASSNTGIVGSNPTRGVDVCLRLFCVHAVALRRGNPPSKEFYRLCIGSRNWKSGQGPKGCRAIERKEGEKDYDISITWDVFNETA
jgi:hypothetical protein